MAIEIERKFLLKQSPQQLAAAGYITLLSEQRIEQTYLAMDSNEEIRVRKIMDMSTKQTSYTHTFKRGNGLVREEIEYEISESIYGQMMKAFGYIPLTKNRITAKFGDHTVEIDIYDQIQLAVLELEFSSLEEAESYEAPEWFGADISSEKQYSNKKVWRELQAGTWKQERTTQ